MKGSPNEVVWIEIPNWDGPAGFQHYTDRDPIWIKNYTRLLAHDEYLQLSGHLRGILHGTWMAYASSARRLRGDTLSLSRRLGLKVSTRDLERLEQAGFIVLSASKPLAERYQDASDPLALARARALAREEAETPEPEGSTVSYLPTTAVTPLATTETDDSIPDFDLNGVGGGGFHIPDILKPIEETP